MVIGFPGLLYVNLQTQTTTTIMQRAKPNLTRMRTELRPAWCKQRAYRGKVYREE